MEKFSEYNFRYNMFAARATLFPDWSDEEVKQHIHTVVKTMKFDDDKPKKKTIKYVFITFDPLYEEVVCVHTKLNSDCKKCKKIRKFRKDNEDYTFYQLYTQKFKIKP